MSSLLSWTKLIRFVSEGIYDSHQNIKRIWWFREWILSWEFLDWLEYTLTWRFRSDEDVERNKRLSDSDCTESSYRLTCIYSHFSREKYEKRSRKITDNLTAILLTKFIARLREEAQNEDESILKELLSLWSCCKISAHRCQIKNERRKKRIFGIPKKNTEIVYSNKLFRGITRSNFKWPECKNVKEEIYVFFCRRIPEEIQEADDPAPGWVKFLLLWLAEILFHRGLWWSRDEQEKILEIFFQRNRENFILFLKEKSLEHDW